MRIKYKVTLPKVQLETWKTGWLIRESPPRSWVGKTSARRSRWTWLCALLFQVADEANQERRPQGPSELISPTAKGGAASHRKQRELPLQRGWCKLQCWLTTGVHSSARITNRYRVEPKPADYDWRATRVALAAVANHLNLRAIARVAHLALGLAGVVRAGPVHPRGGCRRLFHTITNWARPGYSDLEYD